MVMAVVLHFFCTAVFAWVVVEILNVYYIVSAKDSEKTKIPYYLGVGWGTLGCNAISLPVALESLSA